jgi:hypothetical protein
MQKECRLNPAQEVICMSIQIPRLVAVCGALLAFQLTASAAPADACRNILEQFKTIADRANREMASRAANLQDLVGKTSDDKRRLALVAQSCAASAEASGIFRTYRIVIAECTGDRDLARADLLDRIDRSLSQIRVAFDKACR